MKRETWIVCGNRGAKGTFVLVFEYLDVNTPLYIGSKIPI